MGVFYAFYLVIEFDVISQYHKLNKLMQSNNYSDYIALQTNAGKVLVKCNDYCLII